MKRTMAWLSVVCMTACGGGGTDDGEGPSMDSSVVVDENRNVPNLVCPGARGCLSGDGELSVGVGMRVATPDLSGDPVWMGGFDPGRSATGIHDENWARALSLSRGDVRLGIVVVDAIGIFHDDVLRIREGVAAAGLDYDHVTVVATHTHESADTQGFAGANPFSSGYDPDYLQYIAEQSVDALSDALVDEQSASMVVARGEAPELVGDSRQPIVIDQSVHVLRFDGASETIATVVVWGNHPESLGGTNREISSDFPHYLRETLEAEYPGSMGFFIPGTLGGLTNPQDIIGCPDAGGLETCPTGTFEKAEYVGVGAAQAAITALASPLESDDNPALSFERLGFNMSITNSTLLLGFQLGIFTRTMHRPDGTVIDPDIAVDLSFDEVLAGDAVVHTEVNSLTIGPVTLLTLPGEIFPELWLADAQGGSLVESPDGADFPDAAIPEPMIDVLPGDTIRIVVNQANDAIGYIIPKPQFDLVAPFAYLQEGQYGEGSSLGYEMAPEVDAAVRALYSLELE